MEKEIVEKYLINKVDMEQYFMNRKIITREELEKYYIKNKSNFNAIFNATPRKSYKKRREMR